MRARIAVIIAFGFLAGAVRADTLVRGSTLPPLTLTDQHDVAVTIGPETRFIVFTRDMDAGDLVKGALAQQPKLLESAQAAYISDISGMPSMIAKVFAIPAMRKRPYRILLDRDGKTTAALPSIEGQATLIAQNNLQIESVTYLDSSAALLAALTPVTK